MEKLLTFFRTRIAGVTLRTAVLRLIAAVTLVSIASVLCIPHSFESEVFFTSFPFSVYFVSVILVAAALLLFLPRCAEAPLVLLSITLLFFLTNAAARDVYFALVSSAVVGGFLFYFAEELRLPRIGRRTAITLTAILGSLLVLFVGGLTILRYFGHLTPNFDFGIFSQMYHYMAKTLVPYTTCERDLLLSHFAVHFSPILYAALPFYLIFPHPATLLAVQALAVGSGVIPLYLLSRQLGLSERKTVGVILLYVLHPTVIANNFYYFHENCFLTALLLWLFLFVERGRLLPSCIVALLVMAVKEDAPVYIVFLGLYLLLRRGRRRMGGILTAEGLAYFFTVTALMKAYGQGVMTYRYENFLFGEESSLFSVVLNIAKNPAYAFHEMLNADKLPFLLSMLVPLALLPLAIRKPHRLVLLGPFVLVNLLSDYVYQYDIGFQYTYASVAFLFYLTVLNLADLAPHTAKRLLLSAMAASCIFFGATNLSRAGYVAEFAATRTTTATISEALSTIPAEASVRASTFLVPALSERDEIYEYVYSDEVTDYVVLDLRFGNSDLIRFLASEAGYERVLYEEGVIAIFKKEK